MNKILTNIKKENLNKKKLCNNMHDLYDTNKYVVEY